MLICHNIAVEAVTMYQIESVIIKKTVLSERRAYGFIRGKKRKAA